MLLHQLREDLVLALELFLEGSDGAVLGVAIGFAAFVVAGEGGDAVVEELLLPGVEEVDGDAEFFTDVRDRDFLDEVEPESGDLLLRGVVAALSGHGCSSARVWPLTPAKANSCFDWGNTGACSSGAGLRRETLPTDPA